MSATRVIAIRHGETEWNRERRMQGSTDSVLSDLGWEQARALGRRLGAVAFDALYSSDLKRAHDTARCVADVTGHAIVLDSRLRERRFGVFEGLVRDEIKARYPEEYQRFRSLDPDWTVPGGESAREFFRRATECLGAIAAEHPRQTIVVVTHGLVLDSLYRAAHAMSLDVPRGVELINASLNTFLFEAGAWRLERWGDAEHLAGRTSVYVEK